MELVCKGNTFFGRLQFDYRWFGWRSPRSQKCRIWNDSLRLVLQGKQGRVHAKGKNMLCFHRGNKGESDVKIPLFFGWGLDANSHPEIRTSGESSWKASHVHGLVSLVKVGSKPILRKYRCHFGDHCQKTLTKFKRFGGHSKAHGLCRIKVLRQSVGASVWDDFFDSDGKAKTDSELHPPVTSNKVRGPLSGQAKKIGAHAYYLIDHVFFDPNFFELKAHCFEPKRFQSRINALEEVQPSLRNPSDHYPVIADLLQKSTQTAKFCRTCWNANDCQQNLEQSSHTGSLPKKPVQYHCSGKSSCSVMCIFPGVKSWE